MTMTPTSPSLAPILLFVYNRPEHTRRLMESLKANPEASLSELYIFSDAPRDETGRPAVEEVRRYIRSIEGFRQIHRVEQRTNQGLARSIIDGVTQVVNRHGRVIVLEDDLVVSPYFLRFMNDALDTYQDEERVGHIQACDFTGDPALPETFLIAWTGSWGWGTWARAWKHFNPDGAALLNELKTRQLTHRFDFDGNYRYTRMLRRQVEGKNNSWAIRWNASLFLKGILSLNVGRSLVQNKGFDGSGTHCGGGGLYASTLWNAPLAVTPIHPIVENEEARRCLARYYHRHFGFWAKALRRIRRTLHGDFGA